VTGFIRRTILGGVFILLPILGAVYLLSGFVRGVQKILAPIAGYVPGPAGLIGKEVLAVILVAALCFVLGLAVETRIGRTLARFAEGSILIKLPGYTFFKRLVGNFAGAEKSFAKPVLVQFDDSAQFGFLIDDAEQATVFVPSSPGVAAGTVVVVSRARVRELDVSAQEMLQSLTKWGFESQRFLGPKQPAA
jgi:uncharacterized membrane protein